jgi:hypothetical protein
MSLTFVSSSRVSTVASIAPPQRLDASGQQAYEAPLTGWPIADGLASVRDRVVELACQMRAAGADVNIRPDEQSMPAATRRLYCYLGS